MLPYQGKIRFSNHAELYDMLIPKYNVLRRINELVDFRFVYDELIDKYCPDNGREAYDPLMMFKYLLLKAIDDLSDVDVVEHSRYDLSYKYFLGLMPEDDVIDPSSLCKFRRMRLKDEHLLDLLVSKTVALADEMGIVKSGTIIVDSTHTRSRYNPGPNMFALRRRSSLLRRTVERVDKVLYDSLGKEVDLNQEDLDGEMKYSDDLIANVQKDPIISSYPAVKEKINLLAEALDDIRDHDSTSIDKDVRFGHKTADTSFFGYKTHIAMTPERIIVAATVMPGNAGDGPELEGLVGKSQANGIKVDAVVGDAAYSGMRNILVANEGKIQLVSRLNKAISNRGTHTNQNQRFFKIAPD